MSKDDVRLRILKAAGPVFAEKGYDAATVREICQEAGVNVAAVHYYFGSKQRLYVETVKWAHQPTGEPERRADWPPGTPPATKLRDYIHEMLKRMRGQRAPWQRQLMMREVLNPTVACRELVQDYFRARVAQLHTILDEILPADVPQHRREQIGFSIIGQNLYYHVAHEVVALLVGESQLKRHYGDRELADHITQFTLAALGLAPTFVARPDRPLSVRPTIPE
jgi:AcrR family transcriptional regulator